MLTSIGYERMSSICARTFLAEKELHICEQESSTYHRALSQAQNIASCIGCILHLPLSWPSCKKTSFSKMHFEEISK